MSIPTVLRKHKWDLLLHLRGLRFRTFLRKARRTSKPLFFVILVPEVLHIVRPCLDLVERHLEVHLIANGLSHVDLDFVRERLGRFPLFNCGGPGQARGFIWSHSMVLDFLADQVKENFGVMDPDCYVLNPEWLRYVPSLASHHLCSSPYWFEWPLYSAFFPNTFFLFFHSSVLKHLRHIFHCSFGVCSTLPRHLETPIRRFGVFPGQFPEPNKPFFDTFQLIALLGHLKGYSCKRIPTAPDDVIHVCGISYVRKTPVIEPSDIVIANARFFSLCMLELPENEVFRPRYETFLGFFKNSRSFLTHHPKYRNSYLFPLTQKLLEAIQPSFWSLE